MTTSAAKLTIGTWQLYLGVGGPLGYGCGSVYTLDELLTPVARLIDIGTDKLNPTIPLDVRFVASDGKTLALVYYGRKMPTLQIWTIDGTMLREEPAYFGGIGMDRPGRLIALRDGYFFSGDELVRVPTDAKRPTWRFGLQKLPRNAMRHDQASDLGSARRD